MLRFTSSPLSSSSAPEPRVQNLAEKSCNERALNLREILFNPDARETIKRSFKDAREPITVPQQRPSEKLANKPESQLSTGSALSSTLHALSLPFRIAGKLSAVSMRLMNPFSAAHVWSGEPHPQGHSPLKYRSFIHIGAAASAMALWCMPRDYVPKAGGAAVENKFNQPFRKDVFKASDTPFADYCEKIVGELPNSGLTLEYVNKRFPGLIDIDKFALCHAVDLSGELPAEFVRRVVLSQPDQRLSLEQIKKDFPHMLESGSFHLKVLEGDRLFYPIFLMTCEKLRYDFSTESLAKQNEKIFADALDSNPFANEMRRHPVFGPFIDDVVTNVSSNLANMPPGETSTSATEILKQSVFSRSRKYVIEHGASDELINHLDKSIENIDKANSSR